MSGPTPSCQVAKLLGSNVQLIYKELLALLQDEALEVSPSPTLSSVSGQDFMTSWSFYSDSFVV